MLLKDSAEQSAIMTECNYQYTMRHYSDKLHKLTDVTLTACEDSELLKTGGTDSHRANIFTHTADLSENELDILLRS